jgi:deferrochelatase/peroxidase EfeB/cytochrome P450
MSEYQRLLVTGFPGHFTAGIWFLNFPGREGGRAFLDTIDVAFGPAPSLAPGAPEKAHHSIGLTYAGLQLLGLHPLELGALPGPFQQGMLQRATHLRDPAWSEPIGKTVHAVLLVHRAADPALQAAMLAEGEVVRAAPPKLAAALAEASKAARAMPELAAELAKASEAVTEEHKVAAALADASEAVINELERFWSDFEHALVATPGFNPVFQQRLHRPLFQRPDANGNNELCAMEYFGFAEGLRSAPVAGLDGEPIQFGGKDAAHFVSADHGPLLRGGSFLVVRKLEQYVESFWASMGSEALAERVVGATRDGDRLARGEGTEPPKGCPFHSHVVRSRLDAGEIGRPTELLRRGMSFVRARSVDGKAKPELQHGLMFMALNADLQSQFEHIQRNWIQGANHVGGGSASRDPIAGLASGNGSDANTYFSLQPDGKPAQIQKFAPFVSLACGDYFLLPGKSSFEAIKRGALEAPDFGAKLNSLEAQGGSESEILAKKYALIQSWMDDSNIGPRFWKYIEGLAHKQLRVGSRVFVADPAEVQAALEDDGQLYSVAELARRLETVTGPFFLGMDAHSPEYVRTRETARILSLEPSSPTRETARDCVSDFIARERAMAIATQPLVPEAVNVPLLRLLVILIDRMASLHFGLPGPSESALSTWGKDLAQYYFRPAADVRDAAKARQSGWQFRAHVDRLVREALSLEGHSSTGDAALRRRLKEVLDYIKGPPPVVPPLTPEELSSNLLGIVTGSLGATLKLVSEAVTVMLRDADGKIPDGPGYFQTAIVRPLTDARRSGPDVLYREYRGAASKRYNPNDLLVLWLGGALTDEPEPAVSVFGAGPHKCPGEPLAIAMLEGFFEGLKASGGRFVSGPDGVDLRVPMGAPP